LIYNIKNRNNTEYLLFTFYKPFPDSKKKDEIVKKKIQLENEKNEKKYQSFITSDILEY
jgi:hypothetical protein